MYDELVKRLRGCTAEQNGEKTLWHQAADAIEELRTDIKDCRNELCLRCGQYKTKHLGSCEGCRWTT